MPIGEYREWVVILPRVVAAADDTGEEVESWPDPPEVTTRHAAKWDGITGSETTSAQKQTYRTSTLRFRCEVPVTAVDKVRTDDGDTWTVTGAWRERAKEGRGYQTVVTLIG